MLYNTIYWIFITKYFVLKFSNFPQFFPTFSLKNPKIPKNALVTLAAPAVADEDRNFY